MVREETAHDAAAIRDVLLDAFPTPLEADLVEALRASVADRLGLVAQADSVVGYVLFTPAMLRSGDREVRGMGLAPLAVHSDHQREGIGAKLIEEGLRRLRQDGCPFVIVLGHPEYYRRFGFETAADHGIAPQWEGIPQDAFMVLVMQPEVMTGLSGVARYREEFDAAI